MCQPHDDRGKVTNNWTRIDKEKYEPQEKFPSCRARIRIMKQRDGKD